MSNSFLSVLLVTLAATSIAAEVFADGDAIIVQVRTDATPGVDFDTVRTELFDPDTSTLLAVDHAVDPLRDYALGVRVLEFNPGAGFDFGGTYTVYLC